MAIRYTPTHVTCLSTDTKPTDIPANWILHETNTGKWYEYIASVWTETLNSSYPTSGSCVLAATGSINATNMAFTFTTKPTLISVNGVLYQENSGWSYSGSTATLDNPPGVGGSVWGLKL